MVERHASPKRFVDHYYYILLHIPGNLQWLCALLIPFLRSGNKFVLSKLVHKMSGNDEMANVVLGINIK